VPLERAALNLRPSPRFVYPFTEFGQAQPICIETVQKTSKVWLSLIRSDGTGAFGRDDGAI